MSNRTVPPAPVFALALLAACAGDQIPTEPGALTPARGGNSAALAASPGALALVIPSAPSGTITASVQFTGIITATSSDPTCAAASPLNVPATKPPGSSVYVATFTVAAAGPGSCTITLTDKRGGTAAVQVQVRETPPLDGSKLVYSFSPATFNSNVYARNPDGSGLADVITDAGEQLWPALFPDRSKIVYVSDEAGSLNLFRSNLDGTGREQLTFYAIGTHVGAGTLMPAVSPDGKKIAFALSTGFFDTPVHIHVMDAVAGATPVAITAGNSVNYDPSFTPDGRIVFASASFDDGSVDGLHHSIYVMADNGANLTRLTTAGGDFHRYPRVAPDGTTIAFAHNSSSTGRRVIALMDTDGQNQRDLTALGFDTQPAFSPDGAWVAFTRIQDGNGELMVLKLGRPESEAVNITNTAVNESQADWR